MVSQRFDRIWFVDRHEYWERDCDFEMLLRTIRRTIKTLVGWHSVEVLGLPPFDRPVVMCWFLVNGLDGSQVVCFLLLVPSPSGFAYYSGLMQYGFETDKAHIWPFGITVFLFFALVFLVSAVCHGVFLSKTADPHIVADGLGCWC